MMERLTLTIDGQEVEVPAGSTVLDAVEEAGQDVPTLCHHPDLEIHASCRICMVEESNEGWLMASCAEPARDGMEITTRSELAEETRRMNLELLLSEHPNDCMTCESDGACGLQDLVYEYGIDEPTFGTSEGDLFEVKNDNPFIELDPNKCILCGKCVRVDKDIQCSDAIDFANRGAKSKIAAAMDRDLDSDYSSCVFCGQCVEMCPTGALSYTPAKGAGREYELDSVETTCPYCGVGCQLELKVKDNQIVKVSSIYDKDHPNPLGEACVKGRFAYDFVDHPERLTKPLIKKDGEFEEVEWDEAFDYVAEKFGEIKENQGGEAIAGLTSARCTNEENYTFQKFMRGVLGTNSVDHCARL